MQPVLQVALYGSSIHCPMLDLEVVVLFTKMDALAIRLYTNGCLLIGTLCQQVINFVVLGSISKEKGECVPVE